MPEISSLEAARKVAKTLKQNNFKVFLVGRCVRNLLMNKEPKDFDICTSAKPNEVMDLFPHNIPIGVEFGVVKVLVDIDGVDHSIEVATLRSDSTEYSDLRRPDSVIFTDQECIDAGRRDFRMNGILMNPESMEVIDYVGGKYDISIRRIGCIGDPNIRFQEDPLRMLRAVRFVSQLGFQIEFETLRAIRNNANLMIRVSRERVRDEMTKLITGEHVGDALFCLQRTNLYTKIYEQQPNSLFNIVDQTVNFDKIGQVKDPILAWCCLLYTTGIYWNIGDVLKYLKFSNEDRNTISEMVQIVIDLRSNRLTSLCERRKLANKPNINRAIELLWILVNAKIISINMENTIGYITAAKTLGFPKPLVTGDDLTEWGFTPSNEYKRMLERAFDYQLENPSYGKDSIKKAICEVWYKHVNRLLKTGFFSDQSKVIRIAAKCPKCKGTMMFTTGVRMKDKNSNEINYPHGMVKTTIREEYNCKNDTKEFIMCTNCHRRKRKDSFTVLKDV